MFTLVINNNIGTINSLALLNQYIQLYQNGIQLSLDPDYATNFVSTLSTKISVGKYIQSDIYTYGFINQIPTVKTYLGWATNYNALEADVGLTVTQTSTTANTNMSIAEVCTNIRCASFTTNEVTSHISTLTNKWGIVQVFTTMRITNVSISNTTIQFAKVGLFYTHTAAIEGLSANNMMPTTGVTVSTGLTGNPDSTINAATYNAPIIANSNYITLGQNISTVINLGNGVYDTANYIRFSNLLVTGTITNVRMKLELSLDGITWVEYNMYMFNNVLVTYTSANQMLNMDGSYYTYGIYKLINASWGPPAYEGFYTLDYKCINYANKGFGVIATTGDALTNIDVSKGRWLNYTTLANFTNLQAYRPDINGEWLSASGTILGAPMLRFAGTASLGTITFSCGAPNIRGLVIVQNEIYSAAGATLIDKKSMIEFKRNSIAYGMGRYFTTSAGTVHGGSGILSTYFKWETAFSNESRFINGIETTSMSGPNNITDLMTAPNGSNNGLGLTDIIYMFLFNTDQDIELTPFYSLYTAGTITTATTTRLAEVTAMPAITFGNTKGGFISACADIANRWRIPFAGPTITGIRINNLGTSSCKIAKIGLYSNISNADNDTSNSNLLTSAILTASTFYINGVASAINPATWAGYTYTSSGVGEIMIQKTGSLTILFATGTSITNAGFMRLGLLSSTDPVINVRFNVSITYDNGGNWELYDA
jgi:hypothetical protein